MNDTCNKMSDCERRDDNVDRFPYRKGTKHSLSTVVEEENLLVVKIGVCS